MEGTDTRSTHDASAPDPGGPHGAPPLTPLPPERERVFRGFLRGTMWATAIIALILVLLALFLV